MSDSKLASSLKGIVGEANVIDDPAALGEFAVDGAIPKAVVKPASPEEVSAVLGLANKERLAVVPRGSGTKMALGAIPRRVDIVLSTLGLNRITEHDVPNLSLSVQAGMTLADLQKRLASVGKGSFFPLDPPHVDRATVGGVIATNASGPRRYLYSTARDLLLGVKAVLPTGEIVSFGGKTVKNVSGYDMTKLLIGSFGALGLITEITTKLLPLPETSATLLVAFDELGKAHALTRAVLHSSYLPSAMELMNEDAASRLGQKGKYVVAFNLEGVAEAVDRQIRDISEMGKKEGAGDLQVLRGDEDAGFWRRERDFGLGWASVVVKANFLISKVAEVLAAFEKKAKDAGIAFSFIAHAGNGIIRGFIADTEKPLAGLISAFTDEAAAREGNLVVEAAPKSLKEKIDVWGRPRGDYAVMQRLKKEMDPVGVLNPGRFVAGI